MAGTIQRAATLHATGRLRVAVLALMLIGTTPWAAQTSEPQSAADVDEPCLMPPFLEEDQAAVDQEARDIAWILAGGRPRDRANDGGNSERWEAVPRGVLKWAEGTAIKVAYTYWHTNNDLTHTPRRRIWRMGRAPTRANVKALAGRLREVTGLTLELMDGFHLKPDDTINILAVDDYKMQEWDGTGRDQERYRKYEHIVAGKFFGEVGCWARTFYDKAHRMRYAHLVISFDNYSDAEVTRCLAEGAAWVLGVPMWAPEDDKSAALGPFTLVEALYDPRIEPGMTEAEIYPIVRDRLCAQR